MKTLMILISLIGMMSLAFAEEAKMASPAPIVITKPALAPSPAPSAAPAVKKVSKKAKKHEKK